MSLTSLSALASVSGFVKGNPSIDYYKVLGFSPELVADFDDEYYRAKRQKTTFDGLLTHSRLSNATMVDSDGLIKWGPHNLALNSASPATQSITVISGADYTVECTGVSIVLSGAGTGTVTEGNPVEITASTTTLTLTVTGSTGTMWCYRSDLGGMVNNPDTGDSYVPTTSSAVYLPRRGHHVWNGSAWVNEGLLHESEARTNLVTDSSTFSEWVAQSASKTSNTVETTDPAGTQTALKLESTSAVMASGIYRSRIPVTAGNSFSVYAKIGIGRWVGLSNEGNAIGWAYFDLVDGVVGNFNSCEPFIESVGNGWYRIGLNNSQYSNALGTFCLISLESANGTNDPWGALNSVAGDVVYLWGPQLEQAPTHSSYMPTYNGQYNRTPDILTIPSANLPWPTPKVIGPELVTNGGFDTDSDWTKGTGWSIGGGVAAHDGTGGGAAIYQSSILSTGNVYLIQFDLVVTSGSGVAFRPSTFSATTQIQFTSSGSYELVFVSIDGGVAFAALASFVGSIDNISVREIDPLSVSIQMDGRVTFADTNVASSVDGGVGEAVFSLWKSSSSNYIESVLDTDNGTGMASFIQEGGGARDPVSSTGSYFTPGTFVPYNIASRHGSTFINGAVDGTALTADNTPVALPDLSSTDLSLGYDYMGCIKLLRIWSVDLGDAGIEEASTNA